MTLECLSSSLCFDGRMERWSHKAASTGCEMRFGLFLPPAAAAGKVPALTCLGGLTSNDENFAQKAGAQRLASSLGLALVFPDTSPRGEGVPDDPAMDVGVGAGFYLTATEAPWAGHYDMAAYVVYELPTLLETRFPIRTDRRGITGFSMGGHGALVSALRNPGRYASLSAISPIAHPSATDWGRRAFAAYLGPDEEGWARWDASLLLRQTSFPGPILVDQGAADPHLERLRPDALEAAAGASGQEFVLRRHAGYDHSFWFVASVIGDHLAHHARHLLHA